MRLSKVVIENDPGSAIYSELRHECDVSLEFFKNRRLGMEQRGDSATAIGSAAPAALVLSKRG